MGHRCSSGCGWDSCEVVSRCLKVREGGKEDEMGCILGDMGAEMTHERRSGNPFPSAISAHQQCRVFPRLLLVFLGSSYVPRNVLRIKAEFHSTKTWYSG